MKRIDNKGFSLVETLLCFVILGIIMVIASQIIYTNSEAYYNARSVSYGLQAAQIVATELRGEIEDALPLILYDEQEKNYNENGYYINISNAQGAKYIEFIGADGEQVKYSFDGSGTSPVLNVYSLEAYDKRTLKRKLDPVNVVTGSNAPNSSYTYKKNYDSKYIGMGYEIHDIKIEEFEKVPSPSESNWSYKNNGPIELEIGDYPVLAMTIIVGNNQYDEYECTEYIPLYNFYGIIDLDSDTAFKSIINIIS